MKIICQDSTGVAEELTVGNTYDVISVSGGGDSEGAHFSRYDVRNDQGRRQSYDERRFTTVVPETLVGTTRARAPRVTSSRQSLSRLPG